MATRFSVEAIFKAIDKFTAPVTAMQNRVGKFTRTLNANFRSLNRTVDKVARAIWQAGKVALQFTTGAIVAVGAGLLGIVGQFSKIENARAAFTPLLGSVEKAKQLVEELNTLMVDTPFEFEALSDAASQLLPVMNQDIQKTIDTMKMLGDTAGGNAQKLESITRGFTKAMLKGKVDLESLNMIGEAGVPIFTELAKSMGRDVNDGFFKMISAGKVSTAQLTKAFQQMTSEGGIFFNGMKVASTTTSALWSGFMDNIKSTAAVIGEELSPYVKELILFMTDVTYKIRQWISLNREFIQAKLADYVARIKVRFDQLLQSFQKTGDGASRMEKFVEFFFSLGSAIAWVIEHADMLGKLVKWFIILALVVKAFAIAMAIANLVMLANPIGIIIVAIGLLIAAVAAVVVWFDEIKAAFNDLPGWAQAAIALVMGPIGLLIGGAKLLSEAWDLFGEDFKDLWSSIVDYATAAANKVMGIVGKMNDFALAPARFLGLVDEKAGDGVRAAGSSAPQVVGPQERSVKIMEQSSAMSFAEVLIKDSTGKAEMTTRGQAPGVKFSMVPTGGF